MKCTKEYNRGVIDGWDSCVESFTKQEWKIYVLGFIGFFVGVWCGIAISR